MPRILTRFSVLMVLVLLFAASDAPANSDSADDSSDMSGGEVLADASERSSTPPDYRARGVSKSGPVQSEQQMADLEDTIEQWAGQAKGVSVSKEVTWSR